MVVAMVEPSRRTHCFALLSGSMLSGIGSGPLLGKLAGFAGLPVQTAFAFAAVAAVLGGLYFWRLGAREETRMRSSERVQISLKATAQVMRSPSGLSILMVGLGGAVFGVMGSFQTSYATSLGLDYSLFFIGFMGAAIVCRLLIAKWVVQRNPFLASCVLTSLMLIAVIGFGEWVHDSLGYLLTAALLGVGYGLNYSVPGGQRGAPGADRPGVVAVQPVLFHGGVRVPLYRRQTDQPYRCTGDVAGSGAGGRVGLGAECRALAVLAVYQNGAGGTLIQGLAVEPCAGASPVWHLFVAGIEFPPSLSGLTVRRGSRRRPCPVPAPGAVCRIARRGRRHRTAGHPGYCVPRHSARRAVPAHRRFPWPGP